MVTVEAKHIEKLDDGFKSLLNTLHIDEISNQIKDDEIILMLGNRAKKRRKNKKVETTNYVRSKMRLTARLYLTFNQMYIQQSDVLIREKQENAADMFRRETITILGKAINEICKSDESDDDGCSITNQKSPLKLSFFSLLKNNANCLIGYFLMRNKDGYSKRVTDFLNVLELFEVELFGDALYDVNYRKNMKQRKPKHMPQSEDVEALMDE